MHTVARMETKETQTRFPTLQRLMGEVLSLRASYGHTGETRSESDVGVSTHCLVANRARSNSTCRKGRDDELSECAMEVMLSLSHSQGLAAHGRRGPDRHKRPGSIAFRDLGREVFLLLGPACLLQLCRTTIPWRRTASLGYSECPARLGRTHHQHHFAAIDNGTKG